jgi:hypothetical protein
MVFVLEINVDIQYNLNTIPLFDMLLFDLMLHAQIQYQCVFYVPRNDEHTTDRIKLGKTSWTKDQPS